MRGETVASGYVPLQVRISIRVVHLPRFPRSALGCRDPECALCQFNPVRLYQRNCTLSRRCGILSCT